jgi:hypothetical protein
MATRIGGPVISGFNPGVKTWAGMRHPLVLNGFVWNASYTEFSRQWPPSLGPLPSAPSWTSYKYFKWNSGSLFRHAPLGSPRAPNIECLSQEESFDPPYPSNTTLSIGSPPFMTVDNNDFLQLLGQPIDIDIGTFIISEEAHSPVHSSQLLTDDIGTSIFRQIYAIGKLTGF